MDKREATWSPDDPLSSPNKRLMWCPPEDSMELLTGFQTNSIESQLNNSLSHLQTEIAAIRNKLEVKPRKVTLATIDDKLNAIISILAQNGLKLSEEE